MSSRIYEAIITKWNADSLGSTFDGGIWYELAPSGTDWPFVVITPIFNGARVHTSSREIRGQTFQLAIHYKEDGTTDPIISVGALMRTLETSIEGIAVASGQGTVLHCRLEWDEIVLDRGGKRTWQGIMQFRAVRAM